MKTENIQVQMRKGTLEFCVLSVIGAGECYPSEIIAELKSAEVIVVEGTLYPLLTRLKNSGLLRYNWVESNAGPPRKYYALTEEGREFLKELKKSWHDLVNAIDKIENKKRTI